MPAGHHDVVRRWRSIEAALAVLSRSRPAERGASILLEHAILPWSLAIGAARPQLGIVQRGRGSAYLRHDVSTRPAGDLNGRS